MQPLRMLRCMRCVCVTMYVCMYEYDATVGSIELHETGTGGLNFVELGKKYFGMTPASPIFAPNPVFSGTGFL